MPGLLNVSVKRYMLLREKHSLALLNHEDSRRCLLLSITEPVLTHTEKEMFLLTEKGEVSLEGDVTAQDHGPS